MVEANARMTPEARRERSLRAWETKRARGKLSFMSTKDRSVAAKRGCEKLTFEQLSERSKKAWRTRRFRSFKEAAMKLSKADVDLASIGYGC
jgi:hypothetical protein